MVAVVQQRWWPRINLGCRHVRAVLDCPPICVQTHRNARANITYIPGVCQRPNVLSDKQVLVGREHISACLRRFIRDIDQFFVGRQCVNQTVAHCDPTSAPKSAHQSSQPQIC